MKENKRGCGCAVTAVIVGLILLVAGALVGWYLLGKYKPSSELADKGKLFGMPVAWLGSNTTGRWLWCWTMSSRTQRQSTRITRFICRWAG